MSYVLAILALGMLIIVHEGGHYLVARWSKMRVERFSVGFGPALLKWRRGETLFQLAPIPFGGFVQITGMNPHEDFDEKDPNVYPNRPTILRFLTIFAGPFTNILFASVLILVTLYVSYRLQDGIIARFRDRFGFTELSDIASLPLVLVLTGVLGFVITPVAAGYSRWQEHEADRFGLEITRDNHAAASAFVRLQEENLSVPRRSLLYKLWRADHPLLGERIDFCNGYHPWLENRPGRYEHLFR